MIPIARPIIGDEEQEALISVLRSGRLAQGPQVAEFERAVAARCKARHAIAVMNGTVALDLALAAMNIAPGDEIITTPFTFVATANAILQRGAKPVFVDIEDETFCIDPAAVKAAITAKTKAIIPVDLYGQPHDARAIGEIAKTHNLRIVEDAAQSLGASIDGRMAGTLGDAGTFSFYATKNIMTGEGGMVLTNDDALARTCRIMRNQGQDESTRYEYVMPGFNYRMTEMQAALGCVQMGRMDAIIEARRKNAAAFDKALGDVPWARIPPIAKGRTHVYHQYTLLLSEDTERQEFIAHLQKEGVGFGVYYPKVLYEYGHLKQFAQKCPVAERVAAKAISIPIHASLSDEDIQTIIAAVRSFA